MLSPLVHDILDNVVQRLFQCFRAQLMMIGKYAHARRRHKVVKSRLRKKYVEERIDLRPALLKGFAVISSRRMPASEWNLAVSVSPLNGCQVLAFPLIR